MMRPNEDIPSTLYIPDISTQRQGRQTAGCPAAMKGAPVWARGHNRNVALTLSGSLHKLLEQAHFTGM